METAKPDISLTPNRGSPIPHVLLLLSLIFSLAAPPFKFRRQLTSITVAALTVLAHTNAPFVQDLGNAQPWSLLWPNVLAVLTAIVVSGSDGPESKYWRVDRARCEAKGMRGFGLRKLRWATAFAISLRGVRWNHQVKNVPAPPPTTKAAFLVQQICDALTALVVTDVLLQLSIRLFWSRAIDSKYHTIRDEDWWWSFSKAAVYGAGPYWFMRLQYDVLSLVAVGMGLSQPADWPPLYGRIRDVTTVRLFWGSFWHQSIRRVGLTPIPEVIVGSCHEYG